MNRPRSRIPTALALLMGVALGWALSSLRPAPLRAGAGDRSGESIVATGPVIVRYDEGAKAPIPLEAVYFLDYKGGRLLATVPTYQQSAASTQIIDTFAERDLVADFKLDLDIGPRPRFLMTTGSLGPYSAGWAPLYVFETTTQPARRLPDPDPAVDGEVVTAPVRAGRAAILRQGRRRRNRAVEGDQHAFVNAGGRRAVPDRQSADERLVRRGGRGCPAPLRRAARRPARLRLRRHRRRGRRAPRSEDRALAVRAGHPGEGSATRRGDRRARHRPTLAVFDDTDRGWPTPYRAKTAPVSYWKNPSH